MGFLGFGKDTTFYDLLEAQAEAAIRAAREFVALSENFGQAEARTRRIKEIEHEADDLTHQLANKTDATFVTPLDKEDINALSGQLDDVTDAIEAASGRIVLYRLTETRPDLAPLAGCLLEATEATRAAVGVLRDLKGRETIRDILVRVHDAENQGDALYRQALADLFFATPNPDPLMIIKWKEVYDRIEIALDSCEDVSNVVESVAIKYA